MSDKHDLPPLLTDEQARKLAYEGFDSYWTEDCRMLDSEAWCSSARAVEAAVRAQFAEHIQRLEAKNEALKRVVETARAVADDSEDLGEDFLVPSHLMAPLSLALDELDAITKEQKT